MTLSGKPWSLTAAGDSAAPLLLKQYPTGKINEGHCSPMRLSVTLFLKCHLKVYFSGTVPGFSGHLLPRVP